MKFTPVRVRGLAACVLALAGAACSNPEDELKGDVVVNGMDPAVWVVKVTPSANKSEISVFGSPDLVGELPVKTKTDKGDIVLTSKTPSGDFVINLRNEKCEDGMTEHEYNWSATVQWEKQTLKGCAGAADAPLPPPKE